MAIFKCKMCGGDLEINETMTVGTCQYCGSVMTLPKLDNDRKANMYSRANHFRRNNEFDKAMGIYDDILKEDPSDAESYWSLVLCKYGIEYVEDPKSHKRMPTCNRTHFESIFADENYKAAIQYADENAKSIYESEAKTIDGIQKEILKISSQEETYDVFICYKEKDASGKRTQDSVVAQELYYELTEAGYKVFFSRITLEGKLGTAYEPYIFAALNSAKVMVVIATRAEYVNSPWVKNEWSRYLALINQGNKKTLIPAYRDMDPYDLPEEFSYLQAQDMEKLGFMQDLIHGIEKMLKEPAVEIVREELGGNGNVNVEALLDRAFICLEDADWKKADELLEMVLNQDPRCARAYIGKMMIEMGIRTEDQISRRDSPISDSTDYQKALRFSSGNYHDVVAAYNQIIVDRIENERLAGIYDAAKKLMESKYWKSAQDKFDSIAEYLDSAELSDQCVKSAEEEDRAYKEKCRREREIQERKAEQSRLEYEEAEAFRRKIMKRIAIVVCPILVIALVVAIVQARPMAVEVNDKIAEINFDDINLEDAQSIVKLNEELSTRNPFIRFMVKDKTKLKEFYQPALDFISNEETKDDPSRNITLEDLVGEWTLEGKDYYSCYLRQDINDDNNYTFNIKKREDEEILYDRMTLTGYDYSEKAMVGKCYDRDNTDELDVKAFYSADHQLILIVDSAKFIMKPVSEEGDVSETE